MPKFEAPPIILQTLAALFVAAVPLFLVAGSVTWAVNDPGLYRQGFEKYNVSLRTGITDSDLRRVGSDIRHYFNSGEEPLQVTTRVFGVDRQIFNQREVVHMKDVKGLVRGTYWSAGLAGLYLVGLSAGGFICFRRAFSEKLALLTLLGGTLTLALVFAVGLFALVGFDALFLTFHQLSFSNDFWQLDPRRDFLVMLFPQGFWFDATMRVATMAVGGALILVGVSGAYLMYRRWRQQQPRNERPSPPLEEATSP